MISKLATALCVLLVATVTCSSLWGSGTPSGTVIVNEKFINSVAALLVPIIEEDVNKVVIPGENEKHFSFSPVHIEGFSVAALKASFVAPNKISIMIEGMALTIPHTAFHVKDKIVFVHASCGGNFWGSTSGTNIGVTLTVVETNGKLHISEAVPNVQFGSLNVQQKMNGVCNLLEKLVQVFIGNINNKIKSMIVGKLPGMMATKIETSLNAAFANLKTDFVSPPVVSDGSLKVSVALVPVHGKIIPPTHQTMNLPSRDLEFFISDSSLNGVIDLAQRQGRLRKIIDLPPTVNTTALKALLPAAYAMCPACPLRIKLDPLDAPNSRFLPNSVNFTSTQTILGIGAVAPNKTDISFVDFTVNGTLSLYDLGVIADYTTLYFRVGLTGFNLGLYKSHVGKVDVALLSGLINGLVSGLILPNFNKKFKGIPLNKTIDGIELQELVVRSEKDLFGVAGNIKL